MADLPPAADESADAEPLSQQDHLDRAAAHVAAAHAHLTGAGAAEDHGQDAPAGDDGEPRGMQRFTARSAQGRSGFPADSGAARTLKALRGKP
jgi:hypothetical protein